jgi:SAM-dependent methyltransferase
MDMEWTPEKLLGTNYDAWMAWTIQAAVCLDVFTEVYRLFDDATVDALAEEIHADRRGVDMLVTALASIDLIIRHGDKLELPEFSKTYLMADSPLYFGHVLVHMSQISPAWTQLSRCVEFGTGARFLPPLSKEEEEARDAARHSNFILAMHKVAMRQVERIVNNIDLSDAKTLLDLGGGPGTYAGFFCAVNPKLKAVVFDNPGSEKVALAMLNQLGVKERVSFEGGDFLSSPLPDGFDVVWMSQVLHGESPERAAKLVKRAVECLNNGGRVIIQEFVLDDDRCGPPGPALFSLNMLVQTRGGTAYTFSEICRMMTNAGAVRLEEIEASLPLGNRILMGYKF